MSTISDPLAFFINVSADGHPVGSVNADGDPVPDGSPWKTNPKYEGPYSNTEKIKKILTKKDKENQGHREQTIAEQKPGGLGDKLGSYFGGAKMEDKVTARLIDISIQWTERAVAYFGYTCVVEHFYSNGLFCSLLVKEMKMDENQEGFCLLPDALKSLWTGCAGGSIHGEYKEEGGYEHQGNHCGFTLPIDPAEVAKLVKKYADTEDPANPLKISCVGLTPAKERAHILKQCTKDWPEGIPSNKVPPGLPEVAPSGEAVAPSGESAAPSGGG